MASETEPWVENVFRDSLKCMQPDRQARRVESATSERQSMIENKFTVHRCVL